MSLRGSALGPPLLSLAAGQLHCTPGEVSCVDGTCVGAILLCDGIWDCPDGADEGPGHCPFPLLPTPPAGTLPGSSAGFGETVQTPLAGASSGECAGGKGVKKLESRGLGKRGGESISEGGTEAGAGWGA